MQLLVEITSKASMLNTDGLSWQQIIDELVARFGTVDKGSLYEICQDPRSSTTLVLGQVNNKLN